MSIEQKIKEMMQENMDDVSLSEADLSKISTEKLQKMWDQHADETSPSPVLAAQLKRVRQELNSRKKQQTEQVEVTADMSSDVAALVEGENLSEEFKQKAATIFEAAVIARVKENMLKLDEQYEAKLYEAKEEVRNEMVDQIDKYLDYVVEQWMEQNKLAVERGVKTQVLESFLTGLKGLFVEHYVDVPTESVNIVEGLETKVDNLKSQLDSQVKTNIDLKNQVIGLQVMAVAESLTKDLVETDKVKFMSLIEDLEVESVESFQKKAQTIKESYFKTKPTPSFRSGAIVTDEVPAAPLTEEVNFIDPAMKVYVSALNNLIK